MSETTGASGQKPPNFVPPATNAKRILASVVDRVARIYRKAHLTTEEARYVHKMAKQVIGLRGLPQHSRRLPEILTVEELELILARAYREHPRYGLIVRTLFETGIRVGELVSIQVTDIDFAERTIHIHGKGDKDRLVVFTEGLAQQFQLHLGLKQARFFGARANADFSGRHAISATADDVHQCKRYPQRQTTPSRLVRIDVLCLSSVCLLLSPFFPFAPGLGPPRRVDRYLNSSCRIWSNVARNASRCRLWVRILKTRRRPVSTIWQGI